MKIYIISDTHLEHKNIKAYTNRPDDWTEQILFNTGNFDADLLIHLGDVSLGNDAEWHKLFTDLPMKCWLILGNHDGKSMNWYMNHGWDFVARNFTMYLYGLRILFTHRPYPFPPMKTVTEDKPRSNFDINVHGHCHNRPNLELETWQKPFILENQDYKPVDLKEFLSEEIKERSKLNEKERTK